MKIGKNMKKIRLERGLSQKQLATAIGVSSAIVCMYESNTRIPALFVAKKMADVLDCKLDDFFAEDGKEAV